jgi:CBS domain-containing protein
VFGALPVHPTAMKMLLAISVDRSETRRGRWRRRQIDLKRQALLPIANIARWVALSAESPALQTAERLRAAAGSPMLSAEDADTLGDVYEIVQRTRLRHQLEQREAGESPSNTITPGDVSTIEAGVLAEAVREILAIQRRMANLSRYVPQLHGAAAL